MKKYVNLFVFVFMVGTCFSQGKAQTKSAVSYKNPVVDIAMPDPTVIKAADGYFYMYATESTRNVPIMKSKDLVQWTFCNTAFTNKTRPRFEPKAGIWAPDINYINVTPTAPMPTAPTHAFTDLATHDTLLDKAKDLFAEKKH